MKKIIVISDSFKGTLSSSNIINIFNKVIKKKYPKCKVIGIRIADGGEGTVECLSSILKGKIIKVNSYNAFHKKIIGKYLLTSNKVAIIEIASSSKLIESHKKVGIASTYGTGLEILDAIKKGAKTIIIGLGGSATNDVGLGATIPLGAKYFTKSNKEFIPTGISLNKVDHIDLTKFKKTIKGINFIGMSDVNNIMFGKSGASYIFGPQKGADSKLVKLLDNNVRYINKLFIRYLHKDVSNIKGSGAAGAFGASLLALYNAKLESGISTLLKLTDFENKLNGCDYVFTGEGKFDSQSLNGKAIDGISKVCKKHKVPCIVICGRVDLKVKNTKRVDKIYTINNNEKSFSEMKKNAKRNYERTLNKII